LAIVVVKGVEGVFSINSQVGGSIATFLKSVNQQNFESGRLATDFGVLQPGSKTVCACIACKPKALSK